MATGNKRHSSTHLNNKDSYCLAYSSPSAGSVSGWTPSRASGSVSLQASHSALLWVLDSSSGWCKMAAQIQPRGQIGEFSQEEREANFPEAVTSLV